MPVKVFSCLIQGIEGRLVEVEADIMSGLSAFTIVGLGDQSVQESKERIRSAIRNTSAQYPSQKKIINLAPADLKKYGPSFDLPIAISLLAASGQIQPEVLEGTLFVGELALNGQLRPVKNALSLAIFAKENRWKKIFLPLENFIEASLIGDVEVRPISNLQQLIDHLQIGKEIEKPDSAGNPSETKNVSYFIQIQGQVEAKRALQIAAAGGHHLLFYGPPGVGKTMLARSLPELLPPLSRGELLETIRIHSAACHGLSPSQIATSQKRPFRQVHHTATLTSLTGGGSPIVPGEISLAHNGVLFLDEFPEFPRQIIESLRQPLEERRIHLSRQGQHVTFPASFQLIAAMNPCPCGNHGDTQKKCNCSAFQIKNYQCKISGPILDRVDLTVSLPRVTIQPMENDSTEKSLQEAVSRVMRARERQARRYENADIRTNSELTSLNLKKYLRLNEKAQEYLKIISERTLLSARGQVQLLKNALTIADLKDQDQIGNLELAEAYQFKTPQLLGK